MQHKNLEVEGQSDPFRLDHEMKKLNQAARNLRHPDTNDENPVGVLFQVKDFMSSLVTSISSIQKHIRSDNKEEAASELKALVGDVDSIAKTGRETKKIVGLERLPDISQDDTALKGTSIQDISASDLAPFLASERFDDMVDAGNQVLQAFNDIDLAHLTLYTQKKYEKVKPEKKQFDFGNDNIKFDTAGAGHFNFDKSFDAASASEFDFGKSFNAKQFQVNSNYMRKGYSFPKPKSFLPPHEHDIVMMKHKLRQHAIGDVCLPKCTRDDEECNCQRSVPY